MKETLNLCRERSFFVELFFLFIFVARKRVVLTMDDDGGDDFCCGPGEE